MFINFFYQLKYEGVPVSLNEWLILMEALAKGLAFSNLTGFYYLARAVLVKSEAYFDQYDVAFTKFFDGLETQEDILDQALEWLAATMPPLAIPPEERSLYSRWNLDELKQQLENRLKQQDTQHHGGSYWIGTGGTSPFGHSGYHAAGIRIAGNSLNRSAGKVAAKRQYREFRGDQIEGVRQFEVALRKLRQLSTRTEGPKDELDLDGTIHAIGKNAGRLELVWQRPRRNRIKVMLLMDSGGSAEQYRQICDRLFTAAHRANRFSDIRFYYFHNCIYDCLYTTSELKQSIKTEEFLNSMNSECRLIITGDASMAPGELMMIGGAGDWRLDDNEPGLLWLQRLAKYFPYSVWLNPIPARDWERTFGDYTIGIIRKIFPMFPLTPEGLEQAMKKLMTK